MSFPRIPGYSAFNRSDSLADLWERPSGDYSSELWPEQILQDINPAPTEWLTIEECYFEEDRHGGRGAVLIRQEDTRKALNYGDYGQWIGHGLGGAGPVYSGNGHQSFENGLVVDDSGITVEFFARVRGQHDLSDPVLEVSHSFLWYWDAIQDDKGWYYLDRAGRDQPLIRTEIDRNNWKVEIRALELRRYLADAQRVLVAQVDHVTKVAENGVQRPDLDELEFKDDWASFTWGYGHQKLTGDRANFSRLLGQYIVYGSMQAAQPAWEYAKENIDYPDFIYSTDSNTGVPLKHTCDPNQLGTYFDRDDSRLHYLTPLYFNRQVLEKYIADPERYKVRSGYLSCLDVWSVSISTNTAGLVEVYLGDIGRDIPFQEWNHWLQYNVAPEGEMSEDRFRRDILNQWVSSNDPVRDLRIQRSKINDTAQNVLDSHLWRDLDEPDNLEFENLYVVTNSQNFKLAVLSLCKAFIETIDKESLGNFLDISSKSRPYLSLLEELIDELGGDRTIVEPFRALWKLRSKGGIAHIVSSEQPSALKRLGIEGTKPTEDFEKIANRILHALCELNELLSHAAAQREVETA